MVYQHLYIAFLSQLLLIKSTTETIIEEITETIMEEIITMMVTMMVTMMITMTKMMIMMEEDNIKEVLDVLKLIIDNKIEGYCNQMQYHNPNQIQS